MSIKSSVTVPGPSREPDLEPAPEPGSPESFYKQVPLSPLEVQIQAAMGRNTKFKTVVDWEKANRAAAKFSARIGSPYDPALVVLYGDPNRSTR